MQAPMQAPMQAKIGCYRFSSKLGSKTVGLSLSSEEIALPKIVMWQNFLLSFFLDWLPPIVLIWLMAPPTGVLYRRLRESIEPSPSKILVAVRQSSNCSFSLWFLAAIWTTRLLDRRVLMAGRICSFGCRRACPCQQLQSEAWPIARCLLDSCEWELPSRLCICTSYPVPRYRCCYVIIIVDIIKIIICVWL